MDAHLEAGLARANARLKDVREALASRSRVDVSGAPPGVAALTLARAQAALDRPMVVVTSDSEAARRTAADLAFFAGVPLEPSEGYPEVLVYPGSDTSPFLEVAPDRRAAMDRLSVLFHLTERLPFRFLVTPGPALLRKVPPREALAKRAVRVQAESELDREAFIRLLVEGGYLRVPVAEDPGTFAVRGAILDVFPPNARYPARIELDDWLVMSIKLFDPDDQRTIRHVGEVLVHPVREAVLGEEEIALAKDRVRTLCDEVNLPTSKARKLVEDVESGRALFGAEALLPAFYRELEAPLDYVPADATIALLDPTAIGRATFQELDRARADREAKVVDGQPCFAFDRVYLGEDALLEHLASRPAVIFHRVVVHGAATELDSPLATFETAEPESVLHLGGEDQRILTTELAARRGKGGQEDSLAPLARRVTAHLESGLRVLFAARTRTQAERLGSLLKSYGIAASRDEADFDPASLATMPAATARVTVGDLTSGFVLAIEGLAVITEEEIFGVRARKRESKKSGRSRAQAFLSDLSALEVGDYVVHVDHGIGRYLGIERKVLAQSQYERMRGAAPIAVEVLLIEYHGGDKLFLPVTRLNQIQKFSGKEGQKPKLDRLGGQTFAKTKAKVQKSVQKLADELLRLYAQRAAAHRDRLPEPDRAYAEFEATFPFDETADQARAIDEVMHDLEEGAPMDRVVCGDVGFGKTEVALRAGFRVAMAGRQVALLCPTTVLAQQHYLTFSQRMKDYPIRVEVLSRFVDKKHQSEILAATKEGKVDILIGTHRLLSKDVHFKNLGLLVVDEEQRFGVTHKERIKQLRTHVDVLTLSATPIPRTLQMAVGGLRDLSLITTPPVDRRAVRTLVSRWDDHTIREAIQRELARGGQAFFVYNRIEGLYERANKLAELVPNAKIAVGHGQMNEAALEQVMTDFVEGRYDVLCSTAIIETGLDIPRANTIVIDRADTFGLSQLYQLRGRVGRSRERAYCYLITPPPSQMTEEARYRIEALERFTQLGSGFHVATLDMELRGAGDLLGAEQSGNVATVGFDLFVHMLEEAVAELRGEPIVHEVDPELTLDLEHFLPEDYIDDVGLRLSFYKRFASADDEDAVTDLAREMEDRFGPPPPPALAFVRAMRLKPALRRLRILGCEATRDRVTLHLREDTPLDPAKIMAQVALPRSPFKLTPDMKLTRRYEAVDGEGDPVDRVEALLGEVRGLVRVS